MSAATMNMLMNNNPLRTHSEQKKSPYPANLMLQCDRAKVHGIEYGTFAPINDIHPCIILERYRDGSGVDDYVVRMQVKGEEGLQVHYISRDAIKFYDRPYTSDLHLRSSFRHRIGFPEGMVPREWRDSESSLFFANMVDQNMERATTTHQMHSDEL